MIRNTKGQFVKGHNVNVGRVFSIERNKKISNARIGIKFSDEHRKKISDYVKKNPVRYWKGKKMSEEIKRKISETKKLNPTRYWLGKKRPEISEKQQGKNHYNWKGGITPENKLVRHSIEYRLWREAVFARDNFTCQKYGTRGGTLRPHHIKNFSDFPEFRFAIDNGITLSEKAHKEFHKKYGRKNNTEEQLEEFLNKRL